VRAATNGGSKRKNKYRNKYKNEKTPYQILMMVKGETRQQARAFDALKGF
jgi:hypothetical protein